MGGGGKWWDEGKGGGKKYGRKCAFKVLCPDTLITMIMGPKGTSKGHLEEETGCRIIFSNRDEFFPGTYCRTLCIYADDPEIIVNVLERVVDIVVQGGMQEMQQPPQGEAAFLGKEEGTFLLRVAVSVQMAGSIIGPKGMNIQAIREETNAKLSIDKNNHFGHQLMKVHAPPDNLKLALRRVNEHVQAEAGTDDFLAWSAVRVFVDESFAKGWEKGGKEPEKGGGKGKAKVIPAKAALADRPPMAAAGGRDRERSPRRGQAWAGGAPQDAGLQEQGDGSFGGSSPSGVPMPDIDAGMLQALAATAEEFPEGSLDMEYILTCELPTPKVSALIGKKGDHIREVRAQTGVDIHFDEQLQGQEDTQQMMLVRGPLLRVYKAHALMMKRYHDIDVARQARQPQPPAEAPVVQELQQQLEDLQRQLAMVKQAQQDGGAGGGGGFKGGKGKSKGKGKKG